MPALTISDIAKVTGGFLRKGSGDNSAARVKELVVDSRKIFSPAESVFIAIPGERHDGHDYLDDLWEKGVRNFIISRSALNFSRYPDGNFIMVPNTLGALQQIAAHHRNRFNFPVVGITGSNGKTIVKEWIYHVLQDLYSVVRSPKSYNSQIGVPLSIWEMHSDYDFGVFEGGISQPGEMIRIQNMIRPDIGLFTNIGSAHQENFKSLKHKIQEKLQLFEESETIIYCKDHDEIDREIRNHDTLKNKQLICWSEDYEADLVIHSIQREDNSTKITGSYKEQYGQINIPFIDKGSIENAIHVWLLMLHLGIDNKIIEEKMHDLPVIAMRLEMKKAINNCTLINDSYNSDLRSLNIALNMLNQQNQHNKKTLVLSDILQSGRDEEDLYREVADLIQNNQIDRLFGIGSSISANAEVFELEKDFFTSTEEFLSKLSSKTFRNEAILLKGSRDFHFEKISHFLEQKMHQTVLEIDMDAMVENLNYFRDKLDGDTRIMAMVKAFSYGSGTYEIANMLQYHRVNYLGVAFADEGVTLREAGITLPIVVMNPEEESFELMMDYELEPEIYNFRVLHRFNQVVATTGKEQYPVHLKLDTGMNRLGFKPDEIEELIQVLTNKLHLKVSSVFSHLAAADEPEQDEFTQMQIDRFDKESKRIIQALGYSVWRHILNSAGIERFPDAQFDMVRLGIGLYGISAIDQHQLTNISTLKSTVTQVKDVEKGETIGYGRTGKAEEDITIAIVPVGYADGLNRALSNGVGRFWINGYFVPIIGTICMDMCMVDITGCDIHEGDEVIVFGEKIPVTEIAEKLGTIPYEVFTGVSSRVKRVYFQE
ncbi:MAG: bifunctional UDP-N-acetylmuramoyl-tripeptide:D-alanyl-D-alanine ligase/alanine racemase [Bacteroidota bacterium]